MFGIAYALLMGEHVRVDVLYAQFSPRKQETVNLVSALLGLAIALIFGVLSIHYVQQAYVIGEQSPDPGGLTHRWILKALIPAGFALLALQSAAEVVKSWRRRREAPR
jgi:TRAP-type mannitol/chloroaromatic compound transport system permease small subunit